MTKKRLTIVALIGLVSIVAALGIWQWRRQSKVEWQSFQVQEGLFVQRVQASATIAPATRILISPPVAGRVDRFLADEGHVVKKGQVIATMSSQDRIALLESPSASAESLADLAQMYLPIKLIAPQNGTIVARHASKGQTLTAQDAVFEIADHLLIESHVDESDIAQVYVGQDVDLVIDAFRDHPQTGKVTKIGHQSVIRNNVNTYTVLIEPVKSNLELRSGMSASAYFILNRQENARLLPAWLAGGKQETEIQLWVRTPTGREKRSVKVGRSNGETVEILSGLDVGDTVLSQPLNLEFQKNSFLNGG